MNFFDKACQEPSVNNVAFGICDDKSGGRAFTDVDQPDKWIATVENRKRIPLTFTAIDKCVIKDNEAPGRGRCDGMLTSGEHLYFVELKDEQKHWIDDAIEQLESTIRFFAEHHEANKFRHKKAFACNRKHRHFQEIDNDINIRFFRAYGFRIDVQAHIIIV